MYSSRITVAVTVYLTVFASNCLLVCLCLPLLNVFHLNHIQLAGEIIYALLLATAD